ncbi:hypothetical protein DL96DRAFT_857916 [Flagelloscypha sp. PMI_526]|nr:hypothetical protein DL96DRAFT_857916 [Flagelloscypha sp. PMI_526]
MASMVICIAHWFPPLLSLTKTPLHAKKSWIIVINRHVNNAYALTRRINPLFAKTYFMLFLMACLHSTQLINRPGYKINLILLRAVRRWIHDFKLRERHAYPPVEAPVSTQLSAPNCSRPGSKNTSRRQPLMIVR